MIGHLIDEETLGRFYKHLKEMGIKNITPFSKGNTSLVFTGEIRDEKILIKLQRKDSPRKTIEREAEILKVLRGTYITPKFLFTGKFEGLDYLVRKFAEGVPILYANVKKHHLLKIFEKTLALDRLNIDHGQIQGGKHIIIGKSDVWIIDFEKASPRRRPKNLTAAISMVFLSENAISRRMRERFKIDESFLEDMREALTVYKKEKNSKGIFELLSSL